MKYAVETINLSKKYKDTMAVQDLSLRIEKGSIFGLIGSNGAGKSTLLKMICGLIHPSSGSCKIFEKVPKQDAYLYRRVGALIENAGLYPGLNAYDNLKLKCLSMGYDASEISSILELTGLTGVGAKKVRSFSLGMKQRLGIAMALLGSPELLILDEPINGLDPQGILEMRNLIMKLNEEQNTTIIISSHILGELSKMATHYGIIVQGTLLETMSRQELFQKCKECFVFTVDNVKKACWSLEQLCGVSAYEVKDEHSLAVYEHYEDPSMINQIFVEQGIKVYAMQESKQDLETYFLTHQGGNGTC